MGCKYCTLEPAEHRRGLVTHQFTSEDDQRHAEVSLQVSTLAGDPVLRQALMDKGIISASDLRKAERRLKATQHVVP
jgi:hypothetical protein